MYFSRTRRLRSALLLQSAALLAAGLFSIPVRAERLPDALPQAAVPVSAARGIRELPPSPASAPLPPRPSAVHTAFPVTICGKDAGNAVLLADGVTALPLSVLLSFYLPDASVTYAPDFRRVTVQAEGLLLEIAEGLPYLTANGRCFGEKGLAPAENRMQDGEMLVPLRRIARVFGAEVLWDAEHEKISLSCGRGLPASGASYYEKETLDLLARIIEAEAGSEPLAGKLAVGAVVLNRVSSPLFPDTVKEVIFDRRYAVQFAPAAAGTLPRPPSSDSRIAAKLLLDGALPSEEALYFFNPEIAESRWISENRPYLFTVGRHAFYG